MISVSLKTSEHAAALSVSKALKRSARYMESKTQERIRSGKYKANAPLTVALKGSSKPLADTGLLLSSINGRVEGSTAIISTNRLGARIQNEGGTITAKRRLWIPAQRWVKKKVMALGTAGALRDLKRSGTVWFRKGYVMYRSKNGKSQIVWYLKKSVTIPQRRFMYIDDNDITVIKENFKGLLNDE